MNLADKSYVIECSNKADQEFQQAYFYTQCSLVATCSPVQARIKIEIIKTGDTINKAVIDKRMSIIRFKIPYINIRY